MVITSMVANGGGKLGGEGVIYAIDRTMGSFGKCRLCVYFIRIRIITRVKFTR